MMNVGGLHFIWLFVTIFLHASITVTGALFNSLLSMHIGHMNVQAMSEWVQEKETEKQK